MNDPEIFDIDLNGSLAQVSIHTIKSARVFHIIYGDRRRPLNITITTKDDDTRF